MKNVVRFVGCVVSIMLCAGSALAATMNDYCITPPFIQQSGNPNLLMMIDNSASMYDLAAMDKNNYCGNAPITSCTSGATGDATCAALPSGKCVKAGTACTSDANCATAGDMCNLPKCVIAGTACTSNADCTTKPGDKCNNKCNTQHVCWDNTYDEAATAVYAGYYDKDLIYQYDFTNKKFTSGATMPTSCTYSAGTTKYVCVVSAGTPEVVTGFTASGKFLNWLTASKFDIEKQILTGGKYDTVKSALTAETRGCSGRKFMKTVDTMPGITFAISGGTASTLGLTSNSTAYGQTFLQIYKGTYSSSSCQNVVSLWKTMTGANEAAVLSALCKCVGGTYDPNGGTYGTGACTVGTNQTKLAPYYQIAYDCACFAAPGGLCNYSGTGSFQNFSPIQLLCEADYKANYFFTGGPAGITDPAASDYICAATSVGAGCTWNTKTSGAQTLTFSATNKTITRASGSFVTDGFIVGHTIGTDDTLNKGPFTIKTVTATVITVNEALVNNGPTNGKTVTAHTCTWDSTGAVTIPAQLTYCSGVVNINPVTDPSYGTLSTASSVSVPGFLVEAGLSALTLMGVTGDLVDGKLVGQIGLTPTPTGLIDLYKDRIRFGAMAFNENGSASECSDTGKCQFTNVSCTSFPNNCANYTLPNTSTAVKQLCINDFPCGLQCSVTKSQLCYVNSDCPTNETCGAITKTDGGKIISYVGAGKCSVTTATACDVDYDCRNETPAGQYCVPAVGDHTSGLIKAIDDIKATSWTPFAEAFYSAIGYLARTNAYTASPPTSRHYDASHSNDLFDKLPSPNTAMSYDSNKNPSQFKCQNNNIMLITDGMSTADKNSASEALATLYASQVPNVIGGTTTYGISGYDTTNSCPAYSGSRSISDLAWIANNRNIKTLAVSGTASTTAPVESSESIKTYVVYSGPDTSTQTGLCDPKTLMTNTATNGGTTLYSAINPSALSSQLDAAFSAVVAQTASGTAASILSNSEGSGASLLQALFFPSKNFDKTHSSDATPTSAQWIGELQSFWYYLDPYLNNTSIREDTVHDFKLNLKSDKVVQFYFDEADKKTKVNKYTDANGDGAPDSTIPDVGSPYTPDQIYSLWKAGENLWNRDLTTNPRTIYTGYNSSVGGTPKKFSNIATDNFNTTSSTAVWDILQIPTGTDADRYAMATDVIKYVHGFDIGGGRNRTVSIGKYCSSTTDLTPCTHVWKLGDIVSSTPKLVSNIRLNNYNLVPPSGYNDVTYAKYAASTAYQTRGMAFVGANDGMLHAFKTGILKELSRSFDKAQITTTTGSTQLNDLQAEVGQEAWAYIPKHMLPYLKYLDDPNYKHIYYVDRSPSLVDASIGRPATCASGTDYSECTKSSDGTTWRTILIGGMGFGGATREQANSSTTAVKPPIPNIGYSSYFALDVTDPANPRYMWEFFGDITPNAVQPSPRLGFSTTGPAIVRISAKLKDAGGIPTTNPDHTKNGKWFAVFASGPLGPIDTISHAIKGQSDRPLRIFIVNLVTGDLERFIDLSASPTDLGLGNAFAGSLSSSTFDADRNSQSSAGFYSDDAVYIGFVRQCTITDTGCTTGEWTKGGVIRLTTKESTDPNNWVVSKLIDNVGPVTTSVTKLQDRVNKKFWLYFGTGRYFFKLDDSSTNLQYLYGIQDPCYTTANNLTKTCTDSFDMSTLQDQSGIGTAPAASLTSGKKGWQIQLEAKDDTNSFLTERVITDPLAAPNGAVLFTTFKPSSDICKFGGSSLLWAVRYDSGSTPPASAMQGKALMQVSTGAFQEIKLSDAFKNPGSTRFDGRRLANPITGVPPTAQGLSLFTNPPPTKKLLHLREK